MTDRLQLLRNRQRVLNRAAGKPTDFTKAEHKEIRRRAKAGETPEALAAEFGVPVSRVTRLLRSSVSLYKMGFQAKEKLTEEQKRRLNWVFRDER